jgi:hypothetical protein
MGQVLGLTSSCSNSRQSDSNPSRRRRIYKSYISAARLMGQVFGLTSSGGNATAMGRQSFPTEKNLQVLYMRCTLNGTSIRPNFKLRQRAAIACISPHFAFTGCHKQQQQWIHPIIVLTPALAGLPPHSVWSILLIIAEGCTGPDEDLRHG